MSQAILGTPSNVQHRALRSIEELSTKPHLSKRSGKWCVNNGAAYTFTKACSIAKRIHLRNVKALAFKTA